MEEITVFKAKGIVTMNPSRPRATHVAVRDGRILGVGDLADVAGWGAYQLDTQFADKVLIPGLIETDKKLRITAIGTAPLHFLVADAKGNAATIEFFDGKMKVHSGKDMPFPVLTNNAYASVLNQGRVAVSAPSIDYLSFNDISIKYFGRKN